NCVCLHIGAVSRGDELLCSGGIVGGAQVRTRCQGFTCISGCDAVNGCISANNKGPENPGLCLVQPLKPILTRSAGPASVGGRSAPAGRRRTGSGRGRPSG